MAEAFAALVGLLARLEDERPYVTVDDVCQPGFLPLDVAGAQALIAACIADRRLFTDARERFDLATGTTRPVRLIRLNRRHPAVLAYLPD
jgi:hypothetical protein